MAWRPKGCAPSPRPLGWRWSEGAGNSRGRDKKTGLARILFEITTHQPRTSEATAGLCIFSVLWQKRRLGRLGQEGE